MTEVEVDSNLLTHKHFHLYPFFKFSSRSFSSSKDKEKEKILKSFQRHQVLLQLLHAVQNGLMDNLKTVEPKIWVQYIDENHPNNTFNLLHEAAISKNPELLEFILSKKPNINKKSCKGSTALLLAVKSGNAECVRLICKQKGMEIDGQDRKGQTPIDLACRLNMIDIVKILLYYGANPMKSEYDGMCCLHHPIRSNHLEMIKLLLHAKCSPEVKDNNGISPIALAASLGYLEAFYLCIQSLMNSKINIASVINSTDCEGYSCFLNAIRYKQRTIILECLKYGADINLAQNEGKNALHIASEIGWSEIIPKLCDNGININSVDNNLDSALHLGIHNGSLSVAECLLVNHAHVNVCNRNLLTPLLSSANLISQIGVEKSLAFLKLLLNNNADVKLKDKKKQTILHLLIASGHIETIELLFQLIKEEEKQFLLNSYDDNGDYPLHVACSNNLRKICNYLISEGANLLLGNYNESLPIHEATRKGHLEIVKDLIDLNIQQITIRNEDEANLIILAVQSGHYNIFEFLYFKDIEMHSKDETGNNILMYACQVGDIGMVKLILKKDFNLQMRNHHQSTPLHQAAQAGQTKMVEYLLSIGAEMYENTFHQTPLTLALDNQHWNTAKVFLNDNNWKNTMEFRFKTGKTHMGYIIMKNEDIANELLNRGLEVISDTNSVNKSLTKYHFFMLDAGPYDSASVNSRYTEFMTIAKYRKEKLILHPLSNMLLLNKWERFGSFFWMTDLITFLAYLGFFTFMIFHYMPPIADSPDYDNQGCPVDNSTDNKLKSLTDSEITMNSIMSMFGFLRLINESLKFLSQKLQYFKRGSNYVVLLMYSSAIFFTAKVKDPMCTIQWSFGTIAIILLWKNVMFYLQTIPNFGIPILMFKNVVSSVIKIILLFLGLMIGYAIAFYIVNRNQTPFQNFWFSFAKLYDMLIGELDYVSYFLDPGFKIFTAMKLILVTLFSILISISLINLMVGIAVGDIDRMMNDAKISMKILQITYLSETESILPRALQAKFYEPVFVYKQMRRSVFQRFFSELDSGNQQIESASENTFF